MILLVGADIIRLRFDQSNAASGRLIAAPTSFVGMTLFFENIAATCHTPLDRQRRDFLLRFYCLRLLTVDSISYKIQARVICLKLHFALFYT